MSAICFFPRNANLYPQQMINVNERSSFEFHIWGKLQTNDSGRSLIQPRLSSPELRKRLLRFPATNTQPSRIPLTPSDVKFLYRIWCNKMCKDLKKLNLNILRGREAMRLQNKQRTTNLHISYLFFHCYTI